VGLVQNLGALRALCSVGIVEGHMKLHSANLALSAGASPDEIEFVKQKINEEIQQGKKVTLTKAKEILNTLRLSEAKKTPYKLFTNIYPPYRILDHAIERSHKIKIFGYNYHPYFLASDCALISVIAASSLLLTHIEGVSFLSFIGVFVLLTVLYYLYMMFKRRILNIQSRSFLQDTVLFILPIYILISYILGWTLELSLDLIGVCLPLYGGIIRIGCFFPVSRACVISY
jgi:hypothetical protein